MKKRDMVRRVFCSGAIMAVAFSAQADVFTDCTAWYIGGKGTVGAFANGDMTDIRHAAIPDSPTHGGLTNACWGVSNLCERVYSAASDRWFDNQRTIYLSQPEDSSTSTYKVFENGVTLPFSATNENYTLLTRVRLDAAQPRNKDFVYVVDLGYNGGSPNYAFAVRYYPESESFGLVYHGGNDRPVFVSPTNDVCTTLRDRWLELSVTLRKTSSTKSEMRIGISADGLDRTYWSTNYAFKTASVPYGGVMYLGGVTRYKPKSSTACAAARASYQMISYWERVLSDDEILEAFQLDADDKFYRADKTVENHPALLKVGDKAWGGDVFGGTADGAATIVTDFQDLGTFPGRIAAGKTLSIPFAVPATCTNLRQLVRASVAEGSGTLRFAIDGTESDAIVVAAGRTASAVFDRPCFTEGAHTLTISRVDSGADMMRLSAIEISGSWRLGWMDESYTPMKPDNSGGSKVSYRVADLTTNGWATARGAVKSSASAEFLFDLDEDCAGRGMTLRVKPYSGPKASFDFIVQTNAVEAARATLVYEAEAEEDLRYRRLSFPFKPGTLSAGQNAFLFKTAANEAYPNPSATWIRLDYYEWEINKDPTGGVFFMK